MIKVQNLIILVFLLLTIVCCEDKYETHRREYPLFKTNAVTEIDTSGVTLNAEILDENKIELSDFGFVWNVRQNPTLNDYKTSLISDIEENKVSARISGGLQFKQVYYVRTYAIFGDSLCYGNEVEFISEGGLPAKIKSFYPESYSMGGDTIKIFGEHFSLRNEDNFVRFANTTMEVIKSWGDSLLVITKPFPTNRILPVTVELFGASSTMEKQISFTSPWVRKADFPGERMSDAASFVINEEAYLGLGRGIEPDDPKNELWKYTPAHETWIRMADFPDNVHSGFQGGAINNCGYIFYYSDIDENMPDVASNEIWKYDPFENKWSNKIKIEDCDMCAWITLSHKSDIYIYDQMNQNFQVLTSQNNLQSLNQIPTDIFGSEYEQEHLNFGISNEEKIIYFFTNTIWEYFPDQDHWELLAEKKLEQGITEGFFINDKIYFLARYNHLIYEYRLEYNDVVLKAYLPDYRYGFSMFSVGNSIYFGLGETGDFSEINKDLWEIKF